MAVVAAFEIHMERKAVGTMNPSMILNIHRCNTSSGKIKSFNRCVLWIF
jgi:hypothetical protein